MRKHLFSVIIAGVPLLLSISCRRDTVAPSVDRPSFDYCSGSTAQCNDLDDTIDQMEGSQDPECQALGASARARFDSQDYGFDVQKIYPDLGLVHFRPIPDESYAPLAEYTTGNTILDPTNWSNGELGRTVIHEEMHHAGEWDEDAAEDMAEQCFPY